MNVCFQVFLFVAFELAATQAAMSRTRGALMRIMPASEKQTQKNAPNSMKRTREILATAASRHHDNHNHQSFDMQLRQ
jgi:hypothetical protein